MKVFIGWSGDRSQGMALALRDWLPLVLHYVEPWMSETDIAAGERWADAVAKELDASNFGIICVTPENLNSPWILFEAGSLGKSLQSSKVIPLLLDLEFTQIGGPLAQFQAKKVDQDGLNEIVVAINKNAAQPVPEKKVSQLFAALWPDLEQKLQSIPEPDQAAKPVRTQHQILEELVAGVRSLESRLRDVAEMASSQRMRGGKRWGRIHPMMIHELSHIVSEKPGDPIHILLFASLLRDDLPWMYELGMEAYRAAKVGSPEEAKRAIQRFRRTADMMMHGPFMEEIGADPRALHMTLRELDHLLPDVPSAEEEPEGKPRRKRTAKEE